MSNHGPLFDEFRATPHDPHGPQHDEHGKPHAPSSTHGALMDEGYRQPTARDGKHGELWDDFGWIPVSHLHGGAKFDVDFSEPAALDGDHDHGTWFDVFRGGTQLRAVVDGKDTQAVVENVKGNVIEATTNSYGRNQGGERIELYLSQVRELRHATRQGQAADERKPVATPGNTPAPFTPSSADAPSAHSATASGGHLPVAHKTADVLDELRKIARGDGA